MIPDPLRELLAELGQLIEISASFVIFPPSPLKTSSKTAIIKLRLL